MINPVLLRSFCCLVEIGHFTRTAEQLHMTQSGVSQHIKKLEEQLGTALLVRQGKGFFLTDEGESLYVKASHIIDDLTHLEQHIKMDSPYAGDIRVMSPGSIGLKLYPHLLRLQQSHPRLILDYRFAPNIDIENAVSEHKIDFGLMTSIPTNADVAYQPIAKESLLLVTPSSVTKPDWQQLLQLGFIDHPDGAHHANLLLDANFPEFEHVRMFDKKGFSNQINLILAPVSLGLGFTVLPAYAVEAFASPELLATFELANPVQETLYLVKLRNKSLPNRMNTVIEQAKKCFPSA